MIATTNEQMTYKKPLDPQEAELFEQTRLGWQHMNLKIVNKQSKVVPLDHNIAQIKVHNAMELQRKYGLPIQLLIYKARQEGVSTFIEACIFEDINRNENIHACIASMDDDSTTKVFNMCNTFQQEMPVRKKIPTHHHNSKKIEYKEPHRSSLLCQTAGKKVLGRGGTTKKVHATEVCFWANAKKQLLGLLQEVPEEPDSMVVLETTANGTGNEFSKLYWAAVKRMRNMYITDENGEKKIDAAVLNGYIPIFLSWQDFPEYQIPLPPGRSEVPGMNQELEEYIQEGLDMTPSVVLSKEQQYFALLKCQNKCGGDWDLFKQEYPRTAREAERSTGRGVFRPIDIDAMELYCKEPVKNIEFYRDEETKRVKWRETNKKENCWSIWYWPEKNHQYCGFGDVAEGALSDSNDPKSDPDRSVAGIMDRNKMDVPAVYYGRPDTIEYGDQFWMACEFYNMAWGSPEMNSIGQSVLDAGKRINYPHIYQREVKEETFTRQDHKDKLGWKTTTLTRKPLIVDLQQVTKEQSITVYDIRIIDEFRTFVWSKNGKPQAMSGEFDDCVIMLGGLLQMHKRCPRNEDLDWAKEKEKKTENVPYMGEVDDDYIEGDEFYEDDDTLYAEDDEAIMI
jgi:hypothetical protein